MIKKKKKVYDYLLLHIILLGVFIAAFFTVLNKTASAESSVSTTDFAHTCIIKEIGISEKVTSAILSVMDDFNTVQNKASENNNNADEVYILTEGLSKDSTGTQSNDSFSFVKTLSEILLNFTSWGAVIMGFNYVRSLRDKSKAAIFTYWSQLSIRLIQIKNTLEHNNGIINNMYPASERVAWESATVQKEEIDKFYQLAIETLEYLSMTKDQMPAYIGWNNDYRIIISFLTDIILYDIRDADNHFCTHEDTAFIDRKDRIEKVNNACNMMLTRINEQQNKAEEKIYGKKFLKSLLNRKKN